MKKPTPEQATRAQLSNLYIMRDNFVLLIKSEEDSQRRSKQKARLETVEDKIANLKIKLAKLHSQKKG